MTESEYNQIIEDTIIQVEDALDELDNGIDFETSAGILTITLENNSQIIINRQISAMQLWMAAKSGGYHFNYDETNGWQDERSGESFFMAVNRCLSEQADEIISLDF
ncbi:MAG: iron donor protein CyaY [gamma proteobacterium symbiont of Taylorina sp.]|nr:iron donor protein CyaY [gamma proteobacterium symbiont of Taylorina sp.]